jgi:starvation-inducible DNA-binding protein
MAEATEFDAIDVGYPEKKAEAIADGLRTLLASSFVLQIKTYAYHWNLVGPRFPMLHKMFQKQYEELADGIDEIAERIRALGYRAPGSLAEFKMLSSVKDSTGQLDCDAMLKVLANDQATCVKDARAILTLVDSVDDLPTIDLLTKRCQAHEKAAWMLRATMVK